MIARILICMVFLSSAGCALAASSVTVYGIVDVAVTQAHQSSGSARPGGGSRTNSQSRTGMDSGLGPGSRFGFKGSEDLGNGMKAIFTLEGGFGVDTGESQQGGLLFGRQAFVGLGGEAWTVTAGRQYAPMDAPMSMSDALGGSYWGNVLTNSGHIINGSLTASPGDGTFHTPSRVDNSVLGSYQWGSFSGSLMGAFGNEDDRHSGRLWSAGLSYIGTPFQLHAIFARFRQNNAAILPDAKPEWLTEYMLGGSYDFEVVKVFAGYYGLRAAKNLSNLSAAATSPPFGYTWRKTNTAWIGAQIPVRSGRFSAQVARSTYEYQSGPAGHAILLGFVYEHFLSKRTTLYANAGQIDNNAYANGYLAGAVSLMPSNGYGSTSRAVSIGMRHVF